MKKSPLLKALIIIVLIFFLLSTALMFVLYLASPSTVLELEDQNIQEIIQEEIETTQTGDVSLENDMIEN